MAKRRTNPIHVAFLIPVAAGVPRNLIITRVGSNQLRADWDAPNTGSTPDYYEFQLRLPDVELHPASWHRINGTSATTVALTAGTEYTIYIRSVNNDQGTSDHVSQTATPGIPAMFDDSQSYVFDFETDSGSETIDLLDIIIGNPTPTVAFQTGFTVPSGVSLNGTDLTVPIGTTQYLEIQLTATNILGSDDETIYVDIDEVAGTPTNFIVTRGSGSGELDLEWSSHDSGGAPNSYEYRIGLDGSWIDVGGSFLQTTITGLENDTEYTIYLRAYNDQGRSDEVSGTGTPRAALTLPDISDISLELPSDDSTAYTEMTIPEASGGVPPYTYTLSASPDVGGNRGWNYFPSIRIFALVGQISLVAENVFTITFTAEDDEGYTVSTIFTATITHES